MTTKNVFSQPPTLRQQIFNDVATGSITFKQVLVEGDYTNVDVPYFEGMQSVKLPVLTTTGKNLFIPEKMIIGDGETYGYYKIKDNENINCTLSLSDKDTSIDISKLYLGMTKLGVNANGGFKWMIVDGLIANPVTLSITSNFNYVSIYPNNIDVLNKIMQRFNIQIEEGTQATSYEPHKSNILTVNEEVELRGIGEVQDALDCLTGEVTERIGEIVLDGSENWILRGTFDNVVLFYNGFNICPNGVPVTEVKSDRLISKRDFQWITQNEGIYLSASNEGFFLSLSKARNIDTTDKLKQWLSQNKVTVQYRYSSESVKTVDLTVIDQDNQPTQLGTFDDTTHVLLNSEGLIPTAALTVRTKIPSASSTSLLMDDISNEQQQLETTVDEQSNNVDATMVATTEIFEETL